MNTLKAEVKAERNIFGKLSGDYVASLAGFEIRAKSKAEALMGLELELAALQRDQYSRRYLVTPKGTVFVMYRTFQCWCYDIIHTSESSGPHYPGSTSMPGNKSISEAFAAMKAHYDQMVADEALQPA